MAPRTEHCKSSHLKGFAVKTVGQFSNPVLGKKGFSLRNLTFPELEVNTVTFSASQGSSTIFRSGPVGFCVSDLFL